MENGNGKGKAIEGCEICNGYDVARATNNPFVDSYLLAALRKKNRSIVICVAHHRPKNEYEKTFEEYMLPPSELERWGRVTASIAIMLLAINILSTYLLFENYAKLVKNEEARLQGFDIGFWLLIAGLFGAGLLLHLQLKAMNSRFSKQTFYLLLSETIILFAGALQIFWVGIASGIGIAAWIFFSFTAPTEPIPLQDLRIQERKAKENWIAWLFIILALLGLLAGSWHYLAIRG